MSKAKFNRDFPPDRNGLSASDHRNQFEALYQGDTAPLRALAQDTSDMTVQVNGALIENFFHQVHRGGVPVTFLGGNSPIMTAPVSYSRIDLLYLGESNVLTWLTGNESANPLVDYTALPSGAIAICEVYCQPTMTMIVDFEDKDANPNDGYIYKDVRPFLNLPQETAYSGGDGITVSDQTIAVDLDTNAGLEHNGGKLRAKVDDSSIERSASGMRVKNSGIKATHVDFNSDAVLEGSTHKYLSTSQKNTLTGGGSADGLHTHDISPDFDSGWITQGADTTLRSILHGLGNYPSRIMGLAKDTTNNYVTPLFDTWDGYHGIGVVLSCTTSALYYRKQGAGEEFMWYYSSSGSSVSVTSGQVRFILWK